MPQRSPAFDMAAVSSPAQFLSYRKFRCSQLRQISRVHQIEFNVKYILFNYVFEIYTFIFFSVIVLSNFY